MQLATVFVARLALQTPRCRKDVLWAAVGFAFAHVEEDVTAGTVNKAQCACSAWCCKVHAAGRGAAGTFLWLAWSPWLMLRRATFMPSSASLNSFSRSQVAGPMVHTTCSCTLAGCSNDDGSRRSKPGTSGTFPARDVDGIPGQEQSQGTGMHQEQLLRQRGSRCTFVFRDGMVWSDVTSHADTILRVCVRQPVRSLIMRTHTVRCSSA